MFDQITDLKIDYVVPVCLALSKERLIDLGAKVTDWEPTRAREKFMIGFSWSRDKKKYHIYSMVAEISGTIEAVNGGTRVSARYVPLIKPRSEFVVAVITAVMLGVGLQINNQMSLEKFLMLLSLPLVQAAVRLPFYFYYKPRWEKLGADLRNALEGSDEIDRSVSGKIENS